MNRLVGYFLDILFDLLIAFVFMFLWNCVIPQVFGLPEITFAQSVGLRAMIILCRPLSSIVRDR